MAKGSYFDTDEFYAASCARNFVKVSDIARNIAWTTVTEWGELQITINLSKPEKDSRDIAAAAAKSLSSFDYQDPATGFMRPCPLCVTQADVECGYARELPMGGEKWALWYSPYAYYNEHCIAMSWEHRPMHVDRTSFECLFDFVDLFPHYFIGSNTDLPIVGGSILGHDHFQGGRHMFPMQDAPVEEAFELAGFSDVQAGIVKWPLSVVRLSGDDRNRIVAAAEHVLKAWVTYNDASVGIDSGFADGTVAQVDAAGHIAKVHNTVTPIVRKSGETYEMDIALRCNITSAEHPLGVFHPHEELHHIKKENIGLIEVMGLAILPPRVRQAMDERNLTRDDVGRAFAQVLEHAGVFKWDEPGRTAFGRFIDRCC